MYSCKRFKAYELVPKKLYKLRGEKAIQLLDKELLIALDFISGQLGATTVNNWMWRKTPLRRGFVFASAKIIKAPVKGLFILKYFISKLCTSALPSTRA